MMLFSYFFARRRAYGLSALVAGIDFLVMTLGAQSRDLCLYALGLSVFAMGMFCLWDYPKWARRVRTIRDLESAPDDLADLPEPDGAERAAYTRLLGALDGQYRAALRAREAEGAALLDYYTLWAHQIKTPIAAMRMSLEAGDLSPDAAKRELFKIERYADMALTNIRLTAVAADLVPEICDLNEIARAAVRKYALFFVGRKLYAKVEPLPSDVPTDKKWLSFALEQLLSNAVKYTFTGGVRVYWENGALCVSDTGVGIRKEDLPRVFEKGYTGYNGRVDARASGLGLYMVKKICVSLGAEVSAESEVGKGSTFRIRFPRVTEM